jgi:GTP-binding protein Era
MRSGFVGIIGRPNVGKSTLINTIVGKKVAITTSKPQTTRNIIQGIYNDDDTQIVFVDTPGIHKPNNKLGQTLNKQAYYSMEDTDILLLLVDAKEKFGKGDEFVINKLKEVDKPVILVINKVDKITHEEIFKKIIEYKDLYPFKEIVPVSALKNDNVKDLIETVKKYLPDEIQYYGKDDVTNKSLEFVMAELVREKVMDLTEQEVPHSLTCITNAVEVGKTSYTIYIDIIVDRESLKKIVIGARGSMIKEIGIRARKDLEKLLNKNVYLELRVKTVKNWRDKEKYLNEYGFNDFES